MTEPYLMWVAGEERPGRAELIPVEDPATGEIFAHCHAASPEDVAEAVELAHAAFLSGAWSRASRHSRADVLDACAAALGPALPELVALEVRMTGRCAREMGAQVPSLVRWFRYYAALLRVEERALLPTQGALHNYVDRRPLGVVAQITPFNHPLLIAVKKLAPALAAGNSVVIKPSELTPLSTLRLGRLLQDAGVPKGVVTVLPGFGHTAGAALVAHPLIRKVDVTGGTAAGRAIGAVAGRNLARYTAELGGKAPLVVFAAADLALAVNGIAFGSFVASGQTCIASTRIIAQHAVLPDLLERLRAKTEGIARRMGSPQNPRSMMGPLVSARQLARVEELVDEAVGSGYVDVLTGGRRMTGVSELDGTDFARGYFYPPTVLVSKKKRSSSSSSSSGDSDSISANDSARLTRLWREEAFGPVIVVVGFSTEDEAIALANDSEFGLGAGVWTSDLAQALRVSARVEAGICWVNTHHRNDPSSPWGGATPSSGVGSENGADAYREYTTMRSVVVNYADAEEARVADDWFREGEGDVRYG
ncbi:aldehyde dehydrogenase [Xylariaceae sp. FL0804]|nr:aldehyde dehydrogenase [Xylariaceae sp. FL0804]